MNITHEISADCIMINNMNSCKSANEAAKIPTYKKMSSSVRWGPGEKVDATEFLREIFLVHRPLECWVVFVAFSIAYLLHQLSGSVAEVKWHWG